ncbi:clustered mitochondria protein [Rhypophila sp. PSN 637]
MAESTASDNSTLVPTDPPAETHLKDKGVEDEKEQEEGAGEDKAFPVKIVLPHGEEPIELQILPIEQIHEIRQSIIEHPNAVRYSCFHLEHDGERINDFHQVSEVPGLAANSELTLVEDPYTEKEARIHFLRIRDLIGAAGDRTDSIHGVFAGMSIHDGLVDKSAESAQETTKGAGEKTAESIEEYDFKAPSSLSTLLPRKTDQPPQTVQKIALSPWNPPPANLRQQGHLLYLTVRTMEGLDYNITAHVGGFYVNGCDNQNFDPSPKVPEKAPKEVKKARSLFSLLEMISPSFKGNYQKLQEFQNGRDPLSTFQLGNAFPSAPWIVPSSLTKHVSDHARSQEPYLLNGIENTDSLRDWNEEFQSAKELPREGIHDKIFRERLLSKLYADYKDAATRGAVLVARGEVAPLNPTEGTDAQIFVYNNVFYSFGADGVDTFKSEGGHEAARVATGKDVLGVKMVNQLDIEGLYTPGSVVVDYLGKRIVGQTIVPGIFKQPQPGENQIHYGALDGKDTVAADDRFVSVFEKLAESLHVKKHPVWDKDGKRFDLEASVEMKGLLGTDGRKYVLDLYRITPLDKLWMDGEPEVDHEYPHRMTVLRTELVESLAKFKMREYINAELKKRDSLKKKAETNGEENKEGDEKKEGKEKTEEKAEGEEVKSEEEKAEDEKVPRVDMRGFKYLLNPDAFSDQKPQTDAEKEAMAQDEKDVVEACEYLREHVIPALLKDLKEADISFPMDGRSLTRQLHNRGINMRYLGTLAKASKEKRLECFRDVCVREMIARSFKHIAAKFLKELPLPLTSACFAHLLNCLLGYSLNPNPVAQVDENLKQLYNAADLSFTKVTPGSLRDDIALETARRFRYTLEGEWWVQIGPLQMLREISLKLGLQLKAKDYAFTESAQKDAPKQPAAQPQVQGAGGNKGKNKKKNKKAVEGPAGNTTPSTTVPHTFSPKDIVNVVPIVKDSCPRSALAEEALEAGRISILQNQRKLGEDLLLESLSLHEQIYGLIHPEVAQMYHTLSQLYYQMGQKEAAVELAKKAVIVSERTVGLDASETVLNYLNLSLFLHQDGKSKEALIYAKHALDLWKIIYGPDHPDTITTMNNYAVMLQSLRAFTESRRWFEEALRVCQTLLGEDTVHTATLLFQLAQAQALDQKIRDAVETMRKSRDIFQKKLGKDEQNTVEAQYWLEQLTSNAVSIEKQIAKQDKDAFRRPKWNLPLKDSKKDSKKA